MKNRNNNISNLRFNHYWTLAKIGEKYGISSERVRQIIGNSSSTKSIKLRKIKPEVLALSNLTNNEIVKELDIPLNWVLECRKGTRHAVKMTGSVGIGIRAEEWAARELEACGFNIELMPFGHPFDIMVNSEIRIDVKKATVCRSSPTFKGISPSWRFHTRNSHNSCDFLFCITGKNDVFIIPILSVPRKMHFLVFSFPTLRPEIGKYQKYHNRYDLLIS